MWMCSEKCVRETSEMMHVIISMCFVYVEVVSMPASTSAYNEKLTEILLSSPLLKRLEEIKQTLINPQHNISAGRVRILGKLVTPIQIEKLLLN